MVKMNTIVITTKFLQKTVKTSNHVLKNAHRPAFPELILNVLAMQALKH
jgi:hypothetical protein